MNSSDRASLIVRNTQTERKQLIMKKILSILIAIMMIASLATLVISADTHETEDGLPEGVRGFDIEGNDSGDYYFEVTKKYFVASFSFTLKDKAGSASDNGCSGLVIGSEDYEIFYFPYDLCFFDADVSGYVSDDGTSYRPRLSVGKWWSTNPYVGEAQAIYLDGKDDAFEGGNLINEEVTVAVECHVDINETDGSWILNIDAAYLNGIRILLNGGKESITVPSFESNNYISYALKLTGETAQLRFAQSMKEIKANVLTEGGMPDDTGMGDLYSSGLTGDPDVTTQTPASTTTAPATTVTPATTNAPTTTAPATTSGKGSDGSNLGLITGIAAAAVIAVGIVVVVVGKKK